MALGPKEMGEAIVKNLKEKTGKELPEWLKLLEENVPDGTKKEKIAWLKSQNGLGHYQAVTVVERSEGELVYDNGEKLVDALFDGKPAELKAAYTKLIEMIEKLGSDIKIKPCVGYVPFYRKKQFLVVKPSKDKLVIGLALPESMDEALLSPAKGLGGSNRITSQMAVVDFKDEHLAVIKRAYELDV
jgi:predicted transport protein